MRRAGVGLATLGQPSSASQASSALNEHALVYGRICGEIRQRPKMIAAVRWL
jgi:hypothetical protein